jgi:hypothetical protein
LTYRLRNDQVQQHIANSSFALSPTPGFNIALDLHVGTPLYVTVQEFYPLQSAMEVRHSFNQSQASESTNSFGRKPDWNPPIVMLIGRGESARMAQTTQLRLMQKFDDVLNDKKEFESWTMKYFNDAEEDFQTTILGIIGKYYAGHLKEHTVLRDGLRLLWCEYLLLNKFGIPADDVPAFEYNLEAKRPASISASAAVIPDTINRFLKAIILPLAMESAKSLAMALHQRLFRMAATQKTTRADADIVLCLLFILVMFLGRTQNALLLLAASNPAEIDMEYTCEQAVKRITQMETQISDYFNDFYSYALSRSYARSMADFDDLTSRVETYARDFDLIDHLRHELQAEYGKHGACSPDPLWSDDVAEAERPKSLKVEDYTKQGRFRFLNVRRLCWKVFMNVEKLL